MVEFTVYETATGIILRSGEASNEDAAMAQAGDGQSVLIGQAVDDRLFEIIDGQPVARSETSDELDAEKARLKTMIDIEAGHVRGLFITTAPGQEMVYAEKRAEAERIMAGYSNTPHLAAEAAREGVTLTEKAAQVLALSAQWVAISTAIEDRRLMAKAAVSIASTIAAAKAAAAIDWSDIEALA